MATVAAWVLVLTIADPRDPQITEFANKEACDHARTVAIESFASDKRHLHPLWPPPGPVVIPHRTPADVFAEQNAVCRMK